MKNVIALVICLIITLGTLLLPNTVRFRDELDAVYCGAPISYLTLDLSNHDEYNFPQNIRCSFAIWGARSASIDWFGFLVSVALFFTIAQIFLYAKDKHDPHHTDYGHSPIKKDLDNLGAA